ncbi:OsmC family protein [Salinibacterium sp. NG22]|uniref:OsmC family protein n=1 Tax=Salinibacterium sp. NG22 TaxID=2792040 RepID=UPI0018CF1025|nr:OsmC family protein [Salinibacterium sp. NG22]MBH0110101.1 OsmC family protein [Salinibacterium sp. NG22]
MTTAPTTYEVHGRSVARHEASIQAGNQTIPIDALWGASESSALPGPADLLASALAACMLKNLERSGALIPFSYESAEIDVRARRQDAPPKFVEFEYEIRLVTNEDERRVDMLHRNLSHYGTVYNTLAAVADVHGTIVVVKPSAEI